MAIICRVKKCGRDVRYNSLCSKHLNHWHRYGKILSRTRYDKNPIKKSGDHFKILCFNQKQKYTGSLLVDKKDVELVKKYKWAIRTDGYGVTGINGKNILIHRLLLGYKNHLDIDHKNHNPLDNRRKNLRFATRTVNNLNRKSPGLGIKWHKHSGKWQVGFELNKKLFYGGLFKSKKEALAVARKMKLKYDR